MIEELTKDECVELLRSRRFGRIAVHGREGIAIFPVNYVYADGHVAIRTAAGTKLDAAVQAEVAFEIDEVDELMRSGWSVLVKGTGYEVTDSVDRVSAELRALPVEPWAPGERPYLLRIDPVLITGRRVKTAQ